MIDMIEFKLNGKQTRLRTDGERKLLWVLRTDLGLTGAKYGCGEGICGACTVILNKKAVRSCQIRMKEIQGMELRTIEGLAKDGNLHPLQKAFIKHGAFQCGFCTSGMILNAYGLLLEKPQPTQGEILQGMNDNFCRCGAHNRIVRAIQEAAREMRG